jgi:GNAT superfamily N-acetyltransferase
VARVNRATDAYPLRHRILHPELAPDRVGLPGDARDGAGHWTAHVPELGLVGVASVMPEAVPWWPDQAGGWRLRGMATAPEVRGWGVGSDLVDAVVDHVRNHSGTALWCTARLAAVGFYQRKGFTSRGERWEEPVIGIHIHMHRPV